MGRRAEAIMGDGQVEDQAPDARCVVLVISDLHVAAPFAERMFITAGPERREIPFIKKVTPQAPTRKINAKAG